MENHPMKLLFAAFAALLFAAGCATAPEKPGFTVRDLGPIQSDPLIRSRDGGYSGLWRGKSYWFFGDTITSRPAANGFCWLSNSGFGIDPQADLSRVHGAEYAANEPVPAEFIPFLPEEAAYNRLHFNDRVPEKQRSRHAIWPGPLVAAPDDSYALIFFSLMKCGSANEWDFKGNGRSVAVWRDPALKPERIPMLFPPGDIELGDAGLALDGYLYLYGCDNRFPNKPIQLGRVKFADALDRAKWEFYAGNGKWNRDAADAVKLFDGAPMLSVHFNRYLGKYLAIYTVPLINQLVYRTAERPEGPWSEPVKLADCLPNTGACGAYSGLGHGEFARDGGRVELVTYYRDTGFLQGEVRLLEVTFGSKP